MADEIRITVCAFQLEISVVGRQPGVEYLRDGYPMVTKNQRAWRLLAPMARVALDTDTEGPLFRHLIHRTMLTRSCLAEGRPIKRRKVVRPKFSVNALTFLDTILSRQ